MKEVFAPHLDRNVKIGACKLPHAFRAKLRLGNYLEKSKLPTMPPSVDYSEAALGVLQNIEGNDALGDCVFAEDAHYIAVVTGNAGKLFSYTRALTVADYSAVTGYDPSNPSSDQGADPTVDLDYRVSHGYADGSKDLGWASVDCTQKAEVQFALAECGNLKLWLGLPDSYVASMPSGNGFVWGKDAPNPSNGHCIGSGAYNSPLIVGSNADGVQVYTWGLIGTMTWDALAALCSAAGGGGAAVRITPDWVVGVSGKTVSGLAFADLVSDCNAVFGSTIPIPAPAPPPAPPSPALVPPTEAQVHAVIEHFRTGFPLAERGPLLDAIEAALPSLWPPS